LSELKTLKIREDTHKALTIIKVKLGFRTYDDTIKYLIRVWRNVIRERRSAEVPQ